MDPLPNLSLRTSCSEEITLLKEINDGSKEISKEDKKLNALLQNMIENPLKLLDLPQTLRKKIYWRYDLARATRSSCAGFVLGSNPLVSKELIPANKENKTSQVSVDKVSFMVHSGRGPADFFNIAAVEGCTSKPFETPHFIPAKDRFGGYYFTPATSNGEYTAIAQFERIFVYRKDKYLAEFSCSIKGNAPYGVLELKILSHYLFAKIDDKSGHYSQCLLVYNIATKELIKTFPLKFALPVNCVGELGCTNYFDLHPKICFGKEYAIDFGNPLIPSPQPNNDAIPEEHDYPTDFYYSLVAYPLDKFYNRASEIHPSVSVETFSHPSIFAEENHFIIVSRGDNLKKVNVDKVEILDGKFVVTHLADIWGGDEYCYEAIDYKDKKLACVYRSKADLKICRIATYDLCMGIERRFPRFPFSNISMSRNSGDNILFQPKIVMTEGKIHYYQMIQSTTEKTVLDHFCLDFTRGNFEDQENEFLKNPKMGSYPIKDSGKPNRGIAYSFIHDYTRK